jgi:hypothetical protein
MLMINENVKGKSYKQLIDFLSKHCDRFAFVENRQMMEMEEERLAFIENLLVVMKGQLLESKIQREWETTKLAGGTANVFYFRLNNATRQFLKERSNSLFDWISPELPEDLMFYQNDQCILAACSHEGYFLVDETIWESFLLS